MMSADFRVRLTDADRAALDGDDGPAAQLAMSIVARMADVYDAEELMDISAAHIDSTIYIGEAGLEFAERLARMGARVKVPATLNVSGLDERHWAEWAVPAEWADRARRQMAAYASMGTQPTWTCAPYQTEFRPQFGQQICWGESNAIVFANSVIGARTERYPDLLDICCAITGRVPAAGLHLTSNRAGNLFLRLIDLPVELQSDDSFYPVLGHLVGKIAQDRIPVIEGLSVRPTEDQLKAFGAAAASSGTVALFHIVGVTPEAPTLEAAFQARPRPEAIDVTMPNLSAARRQLTTADGDQLDMVVLGSPHFSLAEFKELGRLVDGKRASSRVRFLVTSSRAMTLLAKQAGCLDSLAAFGGQVTVDTCPLASPMLPPEIKRLMTNSGKYAYYAPGMLNTAVTYGSIADCVNSAVQGRIVRDESLWPGPDKDLVINDSQPSRASVFHRRLVGGEASGRLLVGQEPLSFWGGYEYRTGEIVDRRHPLSGENAAGRILALPFSRGSSTTTAVLLEAIHSGRAPAAILVTGQDSFFALASIVADQMYGKAIPVVAVSAEEFSSLHSGDFRRVMGDGRVAEQ